MAFHCPCCLFSFDNPSLFSDHLQQNAVEGAHSVFPFTCPFCNDFDQMIGARTLVGHLTNNHPDALSEQQQQGIVVPESDGTVCTMDVVVVSRVNSSTPDRNINSISTANIHKCKYCGRKFTRGWDLRRHERTHTGERPFACPECCQPFRLKTTLTDHLRTHQADGQFEQFGCSVCGKFFLSRSAMKLHLRQHTGETPFRCAADPNCAMAFRTRKLMMTHCRNSHGEDGQIDEEELHERWQMERNSAFHGLVELNRKRKRRKGHNGEKGADEHGIGTPRTKLNRSELSAFSEFSRGTKIPTDATRSQIDHNCQLHEERPKNEGGTQSNINIMATTDTNMSSSGIGHPTQQLLPLSSSPVVDIAGSWSSTALRTHSRHLNHCQAAQRQQPFPRALTPETTIAEMSGSTGGSLVGPRQTRHLFVHSCLPCLNYESTGDRTM